MLLYNNTIAAISQTPIHEIPSRMKSFFSFFSNSEHISIEDALLNLEKMAVLQELPTTIRAHCLEILGDVAFVLFFAF